MAMSTDSRLWSLAILMMGMIAVVSSFTTKALPPYSQFNEIELNYALPNLAYSFEDLQPQMDPENCQDHYFNIHFTMLSQMNNDIREWRSEVLSMLCIGLGIGYL